MLSSVEQAFVGREEIRAPLKKACVGGYAHRCVRLNTQYYSQLSRTDVVSCEAEG